MARPRGNRKADWKAETLFSNNWKQRCLEQGCGMNHTASARRLQKCQLLQEATRLALHTTVRKMDKITNLSENLKKNEGNVDGRGRRSK